MFFGDVDHNQQSKHILKIGAYIGYSILWLADAAQSNQAKIITLDVDTDIKHQAKQHAKEKELYQDFDFQMVDAKKKFYKYVYRHLILLDAERVAYVDYWVY